MDDYDETRKRYVAVYTRLKRQQQALKDKESGLLVDIRDRLTFTITGDERAQVEYISKAKNQYRAIFTQNAFILLNHFVHHPHQLFDAPDLTKMFRKKRYGADNSTDDRRVRDTIQHIRSKLGLAKKKSEDFCAVEGKRFGIRCTVELKRKS